MIAITIRTATQAEQLYTTKQSTQIAGQTGYIGYLQADGQWMNYDKSLYTDNFQLDLEDVLQALTGYRLEADEPLALRADTAQHSFLIRMDPKKVGAGLVPHCYLRGSLDRHMRHAQQGIRFITPDYKEKFRIQDGDMIRVQHKDGNQWDFICRYIDETHLEVGNGLYHICQFAEMMERQGSTIIPLRASLPERCFSITEPFGEVIVLTRGEMGYCLSSQRRMGKTPQECADMLNKLAGVTKAQEAAMRAGSLFGWDTPAADPRNYNEQGQPIKPRHRDRGEAR